MAIKQPQFEEIVELLSKAAPILDSEGLDGSVKDTEKLINRIKGMGSITPSHKNGLYSVLRMMLESNTYYDSKAGEHLDQAFVLIKEALEINRYDH
ncbi:hypothetical protein [Alteromonas sp. a30]|uniref:hypothetical protein n=1 Tax=Alteromonas sp. a30 TaxID=2730917 RepID=UPI002282217D|nr:hypothetical protein [Alteromonas sp. a30]MCY7297550.1 hypothetical protein [Alteromonas sp. a30]